MNTTRFITSPNPEAECGYCHRDARLRDSIEPVPAAWFVYTDPRTSNAVAVCTPHALSMLGAIWALGDTVTVNGAVCEVPAAFRGKVYR